MRNTAYERLEAAIGLLKDWQGNDDITAPIERICEVVDAFDAWKAARDAVPMGEEADPLAPDVLVCLYCETPNGEIHHPLCDVRAGKPRLYKPKGSAVRGDTVEARMLAVGMPTSGEIAMPSMAPEPAKDTPPPFHAVWPMYDDGPDHDPKGGA